MTISNRPDRLELAQLPTPVQFLPGLSAEVGAEIHVKRGDLTGMRDAPGRQRY